MIRGAHGRLAPPQGGHKAIHPQLGTLEDFRRFLAKTREYESTSRSISPSNALLTIRMCRNIPNGFGSALMALCNTPKIRPSNIKISTH